MVLRAYASGCAQDQPPAYARDVAIGLNPAIRRPA